VGSAAARTNRPVVLVAVTLTSALWCLCLIAYKALVPSSPTDKCSCLQAEGSTDPASSASRNESLALALASIASARQGEPSSPEKQAEPGGSNILPGQVPEDLPLSKDAIVARQKADASTLDAQILSEEADPIWSAKVERATAEAIAAVGSRVHLDEVICRATLCRAKVTHSDPEMHDKDMQRLLTLPVVTGQAFALAPPNDDRTTVLYFSRKGTSLSVLQPPMRLPPSLTPSDLSLSEE
jgi:hypothetical protein